MSEKTAVLGATLSNDGAASPHLTHWPRTFLISRSADFWLLGGASIAVWLVMTIANLYRENIQVVQNHFLQVGAMFSMLSILCNYPHFMLSYQLAYSRGLRFIMKHWACLLLVPVFLIAWFCYAFLHFSQDMLPNSESGGELSALSPIVQWFNSFNPGLEKLGTPFHFGTFGFLGTDFLSISVWIMFITVGWHYSKQVFGCMMVYAHYDHFRLSRFQRNLIKVNLFSIAFFNFFASWAGSANENLGTNGVSDFIGVPLANLGISDHLVNASLILTGLLSVSVAGLFITNFSKTGKKPSLNLLISWIAFHVWWIPFNRKNEFYFLVVPFFHSLQYLPFGYRLEKAKVSLEKVYTGMTARFLVLILVGFLGFELFPNLLDLHYETMGKLNIWFFIIALPVFINIHHFFIDSVVWKLDHPSVKKGLFEGDIKKA